ncbi:MAG: ABC transporter permease [Saprospiraceae bacterium]|nr:ABC transporter permease [Saprospiraceae bacterium]
MWSNYLKIAWRSLFKHKLFSFINILGLGLALPFALIALMQIQSTYESDNFHPYVDQTYRILSNVKPHQGQEATYASTPFMLAERLKSDFPFIENATKVVRQFDWELTNKIKTLKVNPIFIQPAFFSIFGFSIEQGSIPVEPNTLVITKEKAIAFFGTSDPIGMIISHPTYGDLKIVGLLKPFKRNTHFRSDVMVSMSTLEKNGLQKPTLAEWSNFNDAFTYIQLNKLSGPKTLNAALKTVAEKIYPSRDAMADKITFSYQSLNNISPDTKDLRNNPYVEDHLDLMVNFSFAIMLLALAGFNYINLTLAKSLARAKEVGVRKVTGALRHQLIGQFLSESIIVALLSLLVGYFILQWMKIYVHVSWFTWEVDRPWLLTIFFICFTIITGAIAGALPAWLLSGFQPVSVLKGAINPMSFGKIGFRKGLVVLQFVVTACFIYMIGHAYHQFHFMATDNINYNRKNIVNISLPDKNYQNLIYDIKSNKYIEKVGLTSTPFGYNALTGGIRKDLQSEFLPTNYYAANAEFIENMKLTLLAGANLPHSSSDSADHRVLINEQTAYALGWMNPAAAIGQSFYYNSSAPLIVTGVVKDFCYADYQYGRQPLIIQHQPSLFKVASLKIKDGFTKEILTADLTSIWKIHHPYDDFAYSWYEQELYDQYYPGADMNFLGFISLIVMVIAVLGLLGIVMYTTEKRVKEIGIRKVLGAELKDIIQVLSLSFIKLLIIAFLIAIPIGYISGRILLSVFTFHDGISYKMMITVSVVLFFIALLTILANALRSTFTNPVKSLRTE